MSKKVIFIGPAYPYRGGIAAFNENLASIFQANGWECKIITFTQQYPNFLFPGKTQLTTEDAPPNLTIQRGIYSTNPINWLKISKQIAEEKPDLLVTQYWMPFMAPAFGTILRSVKKSLPDIKTVTVVHNFKPHESRIGDKQLNKFIVNRTDALVCLSKNVASEILESNPDKTVQKLFHPIYDHYGESVNKNEARKNLALDNDSKYLLFFGLVRSYKGLDNLIKALPLIEDKTVKLLIVGEFYEDEKKYTKLIEELDIKDKVIKVNQYVPNEMVPDYFCASDLVVLPYKTATQSGVVPIAIHFEKNIVVTNVGALSEIINKHKIGIVCDSTPDDIANKINLYFQGSAKLNKDFSIIKQELSWQSFFDTFVSELNL